MTHLVSVQKNAPPVSMVCNQGAASQARHQETGLKLKSCSVLCQAWTGHHGWVGSDGFV